MGFSFQRKWNDQYPTMVDGGAFGEEFNRRMSKYWVETGDLLDPEELIIDILVDDFNARNPQPVVGVVGAKPLPTKKEAK